MEARVQKLLIMVGEEGADFNARDFKKLKEVIVDQYLAENNPPFRNYLLEILTKAIRMVSQKHHFYAGLTAAISKTSNQLSNKIIDATLTALQNDLNEGRVLEVINSINFLSEIMNISLLNSLTLMNILQDILTAVEKQSDPLIRKKLLQVLIRTMYLYSFSLNEKISHDYKKYIEKVYKFSEGDGLCEYLYGQYSKGKIMNYSEMGVLGEDFFQLQQFHSKLKLTVETKALYERRIVEYFSWGKIQYNQAFKEYQRTEGRLHKSIIEQLIESFNANGTLLTWKIILFVKSLKNPEEALKSLIQNLLLKSIRSKHPLVELGILSNLIKDQQTPEAQSIIEDSIYQLFNLSETFDLTVILKLTKMFSLIINNWKGDFTWTKYTEGQEQFNKRQVLLKIVIEKLTLLNDKFILPPSIPKYESPKPLFNEEQYKTAEELQLFETFTNSIKNKADGKSTLAAIDNEKKYQIFLEVLFRRTSLSQTHLNILSQRYSEILEHFKEFDWTLINKIRNFFKNSFFHRQYYLKFLIDKKYLTYSSYVNYIGELKDKTPQEMLWVKVELTELNNEFGKIVQKK